MLSAMGDRLWEYWEWRENRQCWQTEQNNLLLFSGWHICNYALDSRRLAFSPGLEVNQADLINTVVPSPLMIFMHE